ncbi:MAG: hypothetical protein QG639_89, partial [Patescibacteria group bacterium]|nr:hypothetical protein [Patescibacteria group bacterium]
ERKLLKPPEVFTNSLPTAQILQKRGEGKLLFTVHGHRFDITDAEISSINVHSPTWEVPDARLGEFLLQEQKVLRPSVFAILKLLYQHLENGGRV